MTHQMSRSSTRVARSPSKSRSRSSEKFLESSASDDSCRLSTPKFRMITKSPSPTPRRASAVHLSSTGSSPRSSSRSRSLKSKRHSTFIPHSQSGSHLVSLAPRTSIEHSLSVPDGDDGEFHLVRNFSVTSKGVINRGDSFRCKSRSTSLCSTPTSPASEEAFPAFSDGSSNDINQASGIAATSSSVSEIPVASALPVAQQPPADVPKYTVWLMGTNGVGKTAIKNQFMTSEYICQYDNWQDETQNKTVMVSLDGVESELEIVECTTTDDKIRSKDYLPDAFVIVYSVTNRRSYIQARQIVSKLETSFGTKAVILVGNKTDLARLRTVTTVEGRSLAKERGIKFIETSVAINHQLDELLVGVVTQIRIKAKIAEKQRKRNNAGSRSKATCIIKRLWRKTCITSKSCDNLHAL